MRKFFVSIFLCFLLIMISGCGSDGLPIQPTHSTKGSVTLNGKPVENVTVVLQPVDIKAFKMNERPQGKTNAQGEFTIFTYKEGDGAPAGEYKAGVALIVLNDSGDDQVKREKTATFIPYKYQKPETSGLIVTIKAGANQIPPFDLMSK
jgi:hypothetical protein